MVLKASVIRRAQQGDLEAIRMLMEYYDEYINSLSYVKSVDERGQTAVYLHTGIKEELQTALIVAITKFDESRLSSCDSSDK